MPILIKQKFIYILDLYILYKPNKTHFDLTQCVTPGTGLLNNSVKETIDPCNEGMQSLF